MKSVCISQLIILVLYFVPLPAQNIILPRHLTEQEKLLLPDYLPPWYPRELTNPPTDPVRAMAEWEELQAIIITWASFYPILSQIVDHAQDECRVYIVCSDSNNVKSALTSNNVPIQNIRFILTSFNSIWIRDYGPWSVYTIPTDTLNIIDWIYNRPRPADDIIPQTFANLIQAPFYATTSAPYDLMHTGGNFMVDGHGTGFSSKLILQENPGKTIAEIDTIMKKFMGIDRFIKMEVLPYDGIHHIDMHMKLLDEETLLVGEYPTGVSDGPQIEANLAYVLNNFQTCFGRTFKVVRIPMPPDQYGRYPSGGGYYRTYTNSLIVNRTVIIPTYEERYDTTAFRIYRQAMPGYHIVGINSNSIIPSSGAIHCIVKEVGAKNPILISHAVPEAFADTCNGYPLEARVTTNSGVAAASLYWTTDTAQGFTAAPMMLTGNDSFRAVLPGQPGGTTIYYYIAAQAQSGKIITKPLTAPSGFYRFTVERLTGIDHTSETPPITYAIHQNYPNPFNPVTTISFEIPVQGKVTVDVFNIQGVKIWTWVKKDLDTGRHSLQIDGNSWPSGMYFYRIVAGNFRETRRMLLVR